MTGELQQYVVVRHGGPTENYSVGSTVQFDDKSAGPLLRGGYILPLPYGVNPAELAHAYGIAYNQPATIDPEEARRREDAELAAAKRKGEQIARELAAKLPRK